MSIVVFANTKGGSGKTTAAVVFGGQIIAAGGKVIFLEGDPNRPLERWAKGRGAPVIDASKVKIGSVSDAYSEILETAKDSKVLVITSGTDDEKVFEWLDAASTWANFVIADPEGSPNQWLSDVMSQADLVLVPFAPTTLDAHQVARTVAHMQLTERRSRRKIPHRIVITRANPGAIATRDENEIRKSLVENGLPLMKTTLADRPAFRGLFKHNALLSELTDAQVSSLKTARENAAEFAAEILETLRANKAQGAAA